MSRLGGAATGAAGGVVTAGLTIGWVAAAVLITTIAVTVISLCWILSDRNRPHRLALLITAWRHGNTNEPTTNTNPRTTSPPAHDESTDATQDTKLGFNPPDIYIQEVS